MLATWGLSMVMYQVAFLIFGAVTPGVGLRQSSIFGEYTISTYLVLMIPAALNLFSIFLINWNIRDAGKSKYIESRDIASAWHIP